MRLRGESEPFYSLPIEVVRRFQRNTRWMHAYRIGLKPGPELAYAVKKLGDGAMCWARGDGAR